MVTAPVISPFRQDVHRWLHTLKGLIDQSSNGSLSLSRGDIGKAIYYFYFSRATQSTEVANQGIELLGRVLEAVRRKESDVLANPTLATGLAGLGITLEVLINEGFINNGLPEFQSQLDELVYRGCSKKLENNDTDFLHGGTGGFHYLFYRLDQNPSVRHYLEMFVNKLAEISQKENDTLYFTNRFMWSHKLSADNEVILGLSHGMIAPVLVLINLYEAGIAPLLTAELIRKSIDFILCRRNTEFYEPGVYYRFPNSVHLGESKFSERNRSAYQGGLRWCYGDLNVAHLLYKAARVLKVPAWLELAEQTGLATLELKDIGQTRCYGSLFCHGAAGNAYYYKYLANLSQNPAYLNGYTYWLKQAIGMFDGEIKRDILRSHAGYFLEGFVGSSLVLLSELEEEMPYWEKIWLLS